ncbi:MAG: Gfo/Idh/MocA family oxidoreductase [Spirochaetes bacterium]|nr:Gfo/Idh/MocA family oxidoreductase [Spirochaetota bacterium]
MNIAIIGLDTSHSVEFPKRMNDTSCPPEQKVAGLHAVSCLRFDTPFQNKEGLDARQKQLEAWGVNVTDDFDTAVAVSDAIMLEINDPAFHLPYFKKCAALGKPVFLDKPMADTLANAREIDAIARVNNIRYFTATSLRFVPDVLAASRAIASPTNTYVYGPLGKAPAGSSIVWYGVHTVERITAVMGTGAASVQTLKDGQGVVLHIAYNDGRRAIAELVDGVWTYGGTLRDKKQAVSYTADTKNMYTDLLKVIADFFAGKSTPVSITDSLEAMAILDAAERSFVSGKPEHVE